MSLQSLRDNPEPINVARVLDFPGFYESLLSEQLDEAENQLAENLAETYDLDDVPYEAVYKHSTHSIGFDRVARDNVDWLNDVLNGTGITLKFESMQSPREYNFSTDMLFVTVNDPVLLYRLTDADVFEACIKEHFTNRSGFISFYSNDIAEWRAKPLDEWDHNELGTLLTAYLRQVVEDKGMNSLDMIEWIDFDAAVDAQTDFDALYAELGVTP